MQLSPEAIRKAAIEILDRYGLADMTMRRVATHLGVVPGALYWHFKNKQQLIAAIAIEMIHPVVPTLREETAPAPSTDPDTVAQELRTYLLAHRDGAELVSAALTDYALRAQVEERLAEALAAQHPGSDSKELGIAAGTLLHFILGACTLEQSTLQRAELTGEDAPEDTEAHFQESFTRGVGLILRGFENSNMK